MYFTNKLPSKAKENLQENAIMFGLVFHKNRSKLLNLTAIVFIKNMTTRNNRLYVDARGEIEQKYV
jgi:hypothetical protein